VSVADQGRGGPEPAGDKGLCATTQAHPEDSGGDAVRQLQAALQAQQGAVYYQHRDRVVRRVR